MGSTFDFLFLSISPGMLIIDVFASSSFINYAIGFWLTMLLINFVLGVLKRIPFL